MMRRAGFDRMTLLGLVLGGAALLGTQWLDGGSVAVLAQGPAALIVGFGTLGATLLSSSVSEIRHARRALRGRGLPGR